MSSLKHCVSYIAFENPHLFNCIINNIPLRAAIMGEYKKGEHFGYQVNFSDGFKPLFIAMENGWWCEDEAKPYLTGVAKELNRFVAIQLNKFILSNLAEKV